MRRRLALPDGLYLDRGVVHHVLESTVPVFYRADACRRADATELSQTIFSTSDPDMPFVVLEFTRGGPYAPPPVNAPYRWTGLVTYLPSTYFRGWEARS